MTNLKNELPVSVHVASGGDARVRTGGQTISLDGESSASFQVTGGTRFKMVADLKSSAGMLLYLGYTDPISLQNSSASCADAASLTDDVPEDTTVYLLLVDPMTMLPVDGGAQDWVRVSIYG